MKLIFLLISIFLLLTPLLFAEGLIGVNEARKAAGMTQLRQDDRLEQAAYHHADYLTRAKIPSHLEEKGGRTFWGETPGDRALNMSYPTLRVMENFSKGQVNWTDSLDGLMAAIYHRLAFLDLTVTEMGAAAVGDGEARSFVYLMGNHYLAGRCEASHDKPKGIAYYPKICGERSGLGVDVVNETLDRAKRRNPKVILWPPKDSRFALPAFYEETPDPLPDLSMSGYPVSVQFNPLFFAAPKLVDFQLFGPKGLPISLRVLHHRNDSNHRLTPYDFAAFPLDRLEWGQTYRALAKFNSGGKKVILDWRFHVKKSRHSLIQVEGNGEWVGVKAGDPISLYIIPTETANYPESIKMEGIESLKADIQYEDRNTLSLTLKGPVCSPMNFNLGGEKRINVVISSKQGLFKSKKELCP